MTQPIRPACPDERLPQLPPQLAAIMRPELPSLSHEIVTRIRAEIPEYGRAMDGPYGKVLRLAVEQALTSFVEIVADPAMSRAHRDDLCRKLGRYEAEEGRSLDSLQAAYRIGGHVAWHRVMVVGQARNLSSSVMSKLADAVFGYMNELAALSVSGYQEAKARTAEARQQARQRLLQLIVERPAVPQRAIADLAEQTGWPLPEQVTPVAVEPDVLCPAMLSGTDILADLDSTQPALLAPGAPDATLSTVLGTSRAAVGLTVPLADAADSLRWARQALALAAAGIIRGGPVTQCEDNLVTLWLMSDSALADQVCRRQLGALEGLTPRQQERLTETFGAWLETRGTAAEIADRLQVHPQTVRYRIRQLERTLGDQFGDPDARFAMEMVLRVMRLRDRVAPVTGCRGLAAAPGNHGEAGSPPSRSR
jgi:DNA-binding CsgD family transcriptional regulator